MPPNLGGFFMVRSYYPSECHADYFDFERIEALKPAIEAWGAPTGSRLPVIVRHAHMDNPVKLGDVGRASPRLAPEDQGRSRDLLVAVGAVLLEVDRRPGAIVV